MGKRGKRGGRLGRPPAQEDGTPPMVTVRVRQMAAHMGHVERLEMQAIGFATEMHWLVHAKKISATQMQTAILAAEHVGAYDSLILGKNRFPACASYMVGFGGGSPVDEARMTSDQKKKRDKHLRKVKENGEAVLHSLETAEDRRVFHQIVLRNQPPETPLDGHVLARALDRIFGALNIQRVVLNDRGAKHEQVAPKPKSAKSPPFWRAVDARPSPYAWRTDPIAARHRQITIGYLEALQQAREEEAEAAAAQAERDKDNASALS